MMTPQTLLQHHDEGRLWAEAPAASTGFDVAAAYRSQLEVRKLRVARGEVPRGFKIGFTNRTIWQRYNVFAPIWGTVWDTTVRLCEGDGELDLAACCQPRLEPETVFGLRSTPPPDASLETLFASIDWIAPGFEIVQSHMPHWKFTAPDTVADGGLHARLLVGRRLPLREVAATAAQLAGQLAQAQATLYQGEKVVDRGVGANVLDSPLHALRHFLAELRACPGAPDLMPGDVVTTGTWTDAWPVMPGEHWRAEFSTPLPGLRVRFT